VEGDEIQNRHMRRRVLIVVSLVLLYSSMGAYCHLVLKTGTLFTHFAYIPILLAGMWFGRRAMHVAGLLALSLLVWWGLGFGVWPFGSYAVRSVLLIVFAVCVGELREQVIEGRRALAVSEAKYRQLTEESLAGILVCRDGIVLFANTRAGEIMGRLTATLIGHPFSDTVHAEDRNAMEALFLAGPPSATTRSPLEFRVVRPDGAVVWVDVAGSPVRYEGADAFMVHMYDVTDRKEAESKRLELQVLAREQEEQLVHSTRLAELGEMAAAVAHELNQPLTGIRNFAKNALYMLREHLGSPEDIEGNLDMISEQVDRAARIISQMRELTRPSERQFGPVDINAVVRESVAFLDPQLRLSQVETLLDLAEGLPPIIGERIRLEQVLLNLLNNARQAMEDTDKRHLIVRTWFDAEKSRPVAVQVADTGKGFSREQAEKLFTPFYTTKKPGHGTGLGLSISLSIIKDHNGTIEVDGAPEEGASFTVRLPVGQAHERDHIREET